MIWELFFFLFNMTRHFLIKSLFNLKIVLEPKPKTIWSCFHLFISSYFYSLFINLFGSLTFKTCLWVCAIWFPCNWNKHFDLMYTIWIKIIKNHHQSFQLFVEIWWFWINCKYLVNFQFVFFLSSAVSFGNFWNKNFVDQFHAMNWFVYWNYKEQHFSVCR